MNAKDVLNELDRLGVALTLTPSSLRYTGPPGAMTPALRDALVAHKAEVQDLLQNSLGEEKQDETADRGQIAGSGARVEPSPEVQTKAEELLVRMDKGDLEAVKEYAKLAETQSWPCFGMSWQQWADEVTAQPLPRPVAAGIYQETLL